jgi:hypothetical protein
MLPSRVQARLDSLRINAFEAARRGEFGKDYVNDILVGRKAKVHPGNLAKLARALDCSIAYLKGESETAGFADPAILPLGHAPPEPAFGLPLRGIVEYGALRVRSNASNSTAKVALAPDPRFPEACQGAYAVRVAHSLETAHRGAQQHLTAVDFEYYAAHCGPPKVGDLVIVERRSALPDYVELLCGEVETTDGGVSITTRFSDRKRETLSVDSQNVRIEAVCLHYVKSLL